MRTLFLSFLMLCAPGRVLAVDLFQEISAPKAFGSALVPRVDASSVSLAGFISLWSQDCSTGPCGIPQGLMPAREISFDMALPSAPGQARSKEIKESFIVDGLGELAVGLMFYSLCPHMEAGGCAFRYFQVQAELTGAAVAFCAASMNSGDFTPFPVFICAGIPAPGKRLGITLHRRPV
jgi:hypothetical protein